MDDYLPGYRDFVRSVLEKHGARIGCRIRLWLANNMVFEGILMPHHEFSSSDIIVVKLDNGYNIGISINRVSKIDVVECIERGGARAQEVIQKQKPVVKILGCGGTIASRVEYETGAVKPAMSPAELMEIIPELKDFAGYDVEVLFNILSEDMTPAHWKAIAESVYKSIANGVDGIVVTHGTDTMGYTAAALAFSLQNLPMPIALVGAQRSSDRPSTDAALNLLAAVVTTLKAPFGEVVVVMHSTPSDTEAFAHRGVKVRKMHSSRRDAFQSINDFPLAKIDLMKMEIKTINNRFIPRSKGFEEIKFSASFDDKVALVKAYPGFQSEIIDFLVDKKFHGIVIEGTGLGHIGSYTIESIRRAVEEGIAVVMTTQTLFGRVNMNVYTTGRRLLEAGVIPGEDMLPETAYVKLSWVLAQTRDLKEVKKMMLTNYVNEINPVHTHNLYPIWIH
ncbi:Glu-tRNA(Gln) amidotransferase subunit GatD [Ignisphaera sp. 4213-co]|uniref:Glutamyl-tRNA(Gln) amidotransferase subunit D n=1 Tax=Ignisphaera cupida TaxID=3050454 RepID=A0ABD4Z622_9CREN|nr:Glu-tRNA(Gln) amidotransferase subunit GatD [Ignisphaera sp. 4213-co]MDK6028664.1 Glu-tRNA(Gln) amidotransferase subunit GatD [Ignisphaera sp. 4213-co]